MLLYYSENVTALAIFRQVKILTFNHLSNMMATVGPSVLTWFPVVIFYHIGKFFGFPIKQKCLIDR